MTEFTAHEGQDTILVRGTMHHVAMTETEFAEWLVAEACTCGRWLSGERNTPATAVIRRADNSVRCFAARIDGALFTVAK